MTAEDPDLAGYCADQYVTSAADDDLRAQYLAFLALIKNPVPTERSRADEAGTIWLPIVPRKAL